MQELNFCLPSNTITKKHEQLAYTFRGPMSNDNFIIVDYNMETMVVEQVQ